MNVPAGMRACSTRCCRPGAGRGPASRPVGGASAMVDREGAPHPQEQPGLRADTRSSCLSSADSRDSPMPCAPSVMQRARRVNAGAARSAETGTSLEDCAMTHHDTPASAADTSRLIPLVPTTTVAARHPLDPLTAEEIDAARRILVDAGLLGETVRVPMLLPDEPTKDELAAWSPGDAFDRRVDVTLLDAATGAVTEAIVSVTRGVVVSEREHPAGAEPYGQPQYLFEEYERAAEIVKASPEWQAAMRRRGLADRIELAFCSPLAPGFVGRESEVGRRVIRSLRDQLVALLGRHPAGRSRCLSLRGSRASRRLSWFPADLSRSDGVRPPPRRRPGTRSPHAERRGPPRTSPLPGDIPRVVRAPPRRGLAAGGRRRDRRAASPAPRRGRMMDRLVRPDIAWRPTP